MDVVSIESTTSYSEQGHNDEVSLFPSFLFKITRKNARALQRVKAILILILLLLLLLYRVKMKFTVLNSLGYIFC
jgi:hypothetical protein